MEQQPHIRYSQLEQRVDSESTNQHVMASKNSKPFADVLSTDQSNDPNISGKPSASEKPHSILGILQKQSEERWVFEIGALLIATAALAAIITVLNHYNQRRQPEWHSISLNTLISFLGTIAEVCVMVPVATGLDQWKWIWFSNKRRPLSHLSTFDAAGRGIIGSVQLLIMQRARHFAGFACIATILTLGFGPFLQNLIHTTPKLIVDESIPAVVANTAKYTAIAHGNLNNVVDPVLKTNVYDALLNPDHSQPWSIPQYSCSTGNCSWTDVTAFYVRPHCTNLTSQLTTSCNATAMNCTVAVPGGPSLIYGTGSVPSSHNDIVSATMNVSYISLNDFEASQTWPVIQYVRALHVENIFAPGGCSHLPITNKTSFVATSCRFDICAQLLDISVHGSVYTEHRKDVFCNGTYPLRQESFAQGINTTHYLLKPKWHVDEREPVHLAVSVWAYRAVAQFLDGLFDGYSALGTGGIPLSGITPTWTSPWYATWDVLQSIYNGDLSRCEPGEDYLACAMTNTAKAITKSMRDSAYVSSGKGPPVRSGQNKAEVATGQTFIITTFVNIHWWWLTLPVLVWVLSVVTLAGTVWKSTKAKVPGWRDNLLPLTLLYRGAERSTDRLNNIFSNQAWERWAEDVHVTLHVDKDHAALE